MRLTVLIACVFVMAVAVAALCFGNRQFEHERSEKAAAVLASAPEVQPGHCLLYNAPLRRPSTGEQVVFEVERRIGAELRDVVQLQGRAAPESFARLYRAQRGTGTPWRRPRP